MKKRDAVLEDGEVGFWASGQGVMGIILGLGTEKTRQGRWKGGGKEGSTE